MKWTTKTFGWLYRDGKPRIEIEFPESMRTAVQEFVSTLTDKAYDVEIKQHRAKRSLDSNAYFHVLVHKIAEAQGLGEDEVKVDLVLEYGAIMRDENGDKVGFKLPASVDVNSIYKYAKWFDKRVEGGKEFNCYIIYEHTHKLDSKQMARLIDGTVYVAQNEGIETMPPDEIERIKQHGINKKGGQLMGNKDPAVLFYTSDFLTGVADLTMEERGQYITLLCMQHQKGHLSEKTICLTVGNISVDVMRKFQIDENGLYFNGRMEDESNKRSKFIESRIENGKKGGRKKSTSLTISKPLAKHKAKGGENDNENENIDKITRKDIDIFFENIWGLYPLKKGKAKIKDPQKEKLYSIGIDELSRAITRYDSEVTDKTYLQHGSTFFNGGYIDYLDANYQEKPKQSGNPFKDKLKGMIENERNGSNGNNVGYQGGLSKLLQKPSGD